MASIPTPAATTRGAESGFGRFFNLILSDRERFFAEVAEGEGLSAKLVHSLTSLLALCALYGAAAGAFAGPAQALSTAIKLPLLFLGTLAICFPGFFVIQVLVGSRLRLAQVLALVLGSLSLSALLLAAVVPVTAFFLLTGADYYFMAWNLQPFVGDRGRPFQVFRHNEGNFYSAVLYSFSKLTHGGAEKPAAQPWTPPRVARLPLDPGMPAWPDSGRVITR